MITLPLNGRRTVLLVDDQEIKRYTLGRMLRTAGFEVREANTGEEALRAVSERPNLIVLDVRLPDMDGREICRALKSDPSTSSIPILHVSATYTDTQSRVRGLESGADGYLSEPLEPEEFIATVRALLRARDAEEAARLATDRMTLALDHARLGMFEWDVDAGRWFVTDYFRKVLGLPATAANFHLEALFASVHANDRERVREKFDAVVTSSADMDIEFRTSGSPERWVQCRCRATRRDDDGALRVSGTVMDVTDRRRSEQLLKVQAQDLKKLAERLVSSNRELDSFAAIASHDLKEPVRTLSLVLQRLRRNFRDADVESARLVDQCQLVTVRMTQLIDRLLDFARLDERGAAYVPVAMQDVTNEAVANLAGAIEEAQGVVTVGNLPPVRGDRGRLVQVMQNLLANALKFRKPSQNPVVTIDGVREATGAVRFTVCDNGIGLPLEEVQRIFVKFHRADAGSKFPGTGLGLATCKRIVEQHGGNIGVNSERGVGSTFWFTLPGAVPTTV